MGFYCVSKVMIERRYTAMRHLMVLWWDEVLQKWQEKMFEFEDVDGAIKFAADKIMETAM